MDICNENEQLFCFPSNSKENIDIGIAAKKWAVPPSKPTAMKLESQKRRDTFTLAR